MLDDIELRDLPGGVGRVGGVRRGRGRVQPFLVDLTLGLDLALGITEEPIRVFSVIPVTLKNSTAASPNIET